MTTARSRPRLLSLIISVGAAAATCLVVAGVYASRSVPSSPLVLFGCLALIFASVRFHLPVRLGAQRAELSWSEAALVLTLAMVSGAWAVLLTPVAVAANYTQRRIAPMKTLYNVANNTMAAAAAAGVLAIVKVSHPHGDYDLLKLAGAGAVAGLVTRFAVAAVVAAAQDLPLLATWRASAGLQLLTLAGNLALAVSVLILARYAIWMVTVLPIVVVCLHQAYEGRLRGEQEREAGQRHAAAVGRLTEDLDEPGVLRRATKDACALADVDVVEIELPAYKDVPAVLHRHVRRGRPWSGDPADAPALPARVVADVPVPTGDSAEPGRLRAWLVGGAPDLRLGKFEEDALHSLAAHAGTAVRNSRIHARQTYLATHDRLTALPTRQVLIDYVEARFRTGEDAGPAALIVLDLVGYRDILRALGHDVAEGLLAHTARRLWKAVEDGEYVAHVGMDDFGVYLPVANDPAHVRGRALAFLSAITRPIEIGTAEPGTTHVTLTATAGAGYAVTPIGSGAELLRQASVALNQARAENLNFEFYNPAMDELGGPAAVVLNSELRTAIRNNQLDLHYQPIIDLPSGAPLAMEAMLRWPHPTKGLLRAGEFAPVLERSPDHPRFIAWQLERALSVRRRWGDRHLPVSINLATRCLLDRRFPEQVFAALDRADLPPDQLMLEFDETAVLSHLGLVGDVLTVLRLRGVQIAIDNLGTGSSSLFSLLRVPATHVKVDGHYVRDMLVDPEAVAVVCLGLDLCRRADLQFIATGVNSVELITALRQHGCDAAQGPYFTRPLVADAVLAYLAAAPEIPDVPDASVVALDTRRHTPVR
jgi:diguanylate cyclase (GGDEF)-like protein